MSREGQSILIAVRVSADYINPRENVLHFEETSLGMPSRSSYYSAYRWKTRKAYLSLMRNLTLLYAEDLKMNVSVRFEEELKEMFEFEIEIANVSLSI